VRRRLAFLPLPTVGHSPATVTLTLDVYESIKSEGGDDGTWRGVRMIPQRRMSKGGDVAIYNACRGDLDPISTCVLIYTL